MVRNFNQVMTRLLPPLLQKYGAQLDIRLVEVVSTQDVDELYKLGATFGLSKEQVVMLGMIGALARVGLDALTRRQRSSVSSTAWKTWAVPFLVVLGLGVAGYLAYVEMFQMSAICGPVGHCNTVQQSPYARLFGILPIGVLGVLGYLAILGAWFISLMGRTEIVAVAHRTAFAFAVCGVLFSLYLTLLEPFVIGAVCVWCLTSAVIMTALMLLLTRPALRAPGVERA